MSQSQPDTDTDTDIVVDSTGPVGVVRLNRPRRANSVNPRVVTEMGEAVQHLDETDSVRSIILTGTGSTFCSGADVVDMFAVYEADGADALMNYMNDVWMPSVQVAVRALWGARKPVVAAINGAATAGGLDFSLSCDLRVAADTSMFAESYINLGMIPVAGGTWLLPRTVGQAHAFRMLTSGRLIDAEKAHRIGLVDELCTSDELLERATAVAEELSHGPQESVARAKAAVRSSITEEFHTALRHSYEANVTLLAQDEVRGKVLAVMERHALKART